MTVPTFTLYPNQYFSPDSIIQDWHIICAAWKWEGGEEIHSAVTYNTNDKKVVTALREAITQADELVYHNGTKFDYKKINARVLLNGLPPMPKPRETDTLTQCRKHFALTSNRLDYIGKALGFGGKVQTSPGLWNRALQKDRQAIDEMLEYNKYDVILLEKVFQKLKPYIDIGYNHNINSVVGDVCDKCGSDNLISDGWCLTKVSRYRRYQCKACGGYCRSQKREPKE